jgi:acyl carrier protein
MNSDEILYKVGETIRDVVQCGPVEISRTTQAMDVRGWDSLSQTIILLNIEDSFNIKIPMERALCLSNVGDLVDLIAELLGVHS